jgi:hypothetical protein
MLSQTDILRVHAAAISALANTSRTALLGGLPAEMIARFPLAAGPAEQILCDLNALNAERALVGGHKPLVIWLANASALASLRPEYVIFEQAPRWMVARESTVAPAPEEPEAPIPPTPGKEESYARAWLPSALFLVPVMITVAALFASGATRSAAPWKIAQKWVDLGQLIAVVCAFLWEWSHRANDPDHREQKDKVLVEPFARYWNWLGISLCFFYLFHTVREFYEQSRFGGEEPPRDWIQGMNIVLNLLHNLQSALLFVLFWMMLRPNLDRKKLWFELKSWGAPAGVWCVGFAAAQVLLWLALRGSDPHLYLLSDLIAALLAGVAAATFLGMFIGRLESAFLDVHPVELAAFYVYAGIQPFYGVLAALRAVPITGDDLIQPFMQPFFELSLKALACALKLGLYFVVRRQLTSGRLVFYMRAQQALRARVEGDWKRFNEGSRRR